MVAKYKYAKIIFDDEPMVIGYQEKDGENFHSALTATAKKVYHSPP